MVTEQQIDDAISTNNSDFFRGVLSSSCDTKTLLFVLDNLGRLPASFDTDVFIPLVRHSNPDVRLLAVKNLGKVKNEEALTFICGIVFNEMNTTVRREMVSAIGRMKMQQAIPTLTNLLQDVDPKVVLQAIRALQYFDADIEIRNALLSLETHPNELIRKALRSYSFASEPKKFGKSKKSDDHASSPDWLKNTIVEGDTVEALRLVPDNSIHLTFTSPPYYNARDYTLYRSYDEYLEFLVNVFREVHRVTKEGRFFALNTSPVLIPRMGRKYASTRYLIPFDIHPLITKLGFDFVDDIIWVKPDPSAKNRNGGFFQHRKPLGYKANSVCEYVIVYRKATDKLIDWNLKQYDEETVNSSKVVGDYEKTNAWKIAPTTNSVHSAVFPLELASRIIQFYSYRGDLIFDPFGGSGTVANASKLLERRYFLTEINKDYAKYAFENISTGSLYDNFTPKYYTLDQFRQLAVEQTQK